MSDSLNPIDSSSVLLKALESMVEGLRELREVVGDSLALEMVNILIEKGQTSIDLAQCKVIR